MTGRAFDARDRNGELPVAVVNRAFERTYLPAGAVGHRVVFPADDGGEEWLTSVGVVPNLLAGGLERQLEEAVYRPIAQDVPLSFQVAMRSNHAAPVLAAAVREAVAVVDPDLLIRRQK